MLNPDFVFKFAVFYDKNNCFEKLNYLKIFENF